MSISTPSGTPHRLRPQAFHSIKTTGRVIILAILLALVGASSADAIELTLTTSNDLIAGREDDLYTAELGADFHTERFTLHFGERLFTDREVGTRFDETRFAIGWSLPLAHDDSDRPAWLSGWSGTARIEALRVGRGLAGESLQNAVHRVIGSNEVELRYPRSNRHFLGLGVNLERTLGRVAGTDLSVGIKAHTLPGFQHRLEPTLGFTRQIAPWLALSGYAGVQWNETTFDPLDRRIDSFEETWQLALDARRIRLAWNYNSYGTASRHVTLGYRVGVGSRGAGGR